MSNLRGRKIGAFFIFIAVFAAASAIVMLLWNVLIPAIIGWSAVNFWQAAGLVVLCRLLFGGFGKMRGMGYHMFHGCGHGHYHNMSDMHEKMRGMSRDERREFIRSHMAGFAETCGRPGGRDERGGRPHGGPDCCRNEKAGGKGEKAENEEPKA